MTTREESLKHLRIGAWAAQCCEYDLGQIETEEQVEEIREDLLEPDERESYGWRVWPTKEEALEDLR